MKIKTLYLIQCELLGVCGDAGLGSPPEPPCFSDFRLVGMWCALHWLRAGAGLGSPEPPSFSDFRLMECEALEVEAGWVRPLVPSCMSDLGLVV